MNQQTGLGLYLHIPFCRHRCAYCDFNTYTTVFALHDAYTEALCREIQLVAGAERRPTQTIFFGGGTPSLMAPEAIEQILATVAASFDVAPDAEVTMEVNPGTIDAGYLQAVRAHGVNRLSIGAQSADARDLVMLEREHDFATVVEAVRVARDSGFDNLNLDLIYGLPGQDLSSWAQTMVATLDLSPDHLSLYCLIVEPGTRMQRWLQTGRVATPDPDVAADQYELACRMLAERGFQHYEISNWAKPGLACAHNLIYWRNQSYLGFGAGAHGHAAGYRYEVVKQPRVYIRRMAHADQSAEFPLSPAAADYHLLQPAEAMADTMITQLRLLQEGVDLAAFSARFGQPLEQVYDGVVQQLIAWGLLRRQDNHLLLTDRGSFLSNQVFYRFV